MAKKSNKNDHDSFLKEAYLERSLQYITEEFVHKMRELSLIRRISDALIDTEDQQKVCLDITQIILDEIHAEQCALLLVNEEDDNLILKAIKKQGDKEGAFFNNHAETSFSSEEGLAGAVFQSGESIYIKNTKNDKRFKKDPLYVEFMKSVLCIPLISGKNTIGVLRLSAPESNAFNKEDQNLLQIVANQVANVLQNVQLVNNLKQSYRQQEQVLERLRRAEMQLSNYSKDLEIIVEKRTNELVQSEKLATVGQLVAGVAHELNNPLAIIMGYADLLISDVETDEKFISRLEKIHLATMRCAKIVNNLLKFSQKSKIEKKVVNINDLIRETLELFEYQFKVNDIKVKRKLQEDLPTTLCDPQQIQQVFLNLISNSYDAMAKQDDNKSFEVIAKLKNDMIVIEFRDTGPGIDKVNQRKLFEPFFTTKEVGKGTGLGLSLSYGIIKEHNGEIEYDSSYTKGAKFIIQLPVIGEPALKVSKKQPAYSIDSNTKVLIVDDEDDIISFQQDILSNYSCEVDVASSGKKALTKLNKKGYDVIISDIKMPGKIDGINLYKELKKIKPGLEKRMIFTTGDIVSVKTQKFLEDVDNLYLKKPFLISEFIDKVNQCLKVDINN
ncbi:response regulator [candidate division KSB1 bacterium]|nr:response regulator [candidate division KSB1 bacterium]